MKATAPIRDADPAPGQLWRKPCSTALRKIEGTITRVFVDQEQSINDKHPWQIDFRFETPAGPRTGFVTSWDPMTRRREAGERVWVAFGAKDSAASALWPPVW